MRIKPALLVVTAAAALFAPAAPSHAPGARPCDEPGHVGVILFDENGDVFGVCFRTGVVTDRAGEALDWATGYRDAAGYWVDDVRDTRCWSTPDAIVCDEVPPPPLPVP